MATLTEVQPAATLTNDEILRYSRHLIMPEVGMEGQKKLKAARVLCIGAGGLGSPLALYLAAAGVGTLGIVDFDVVDYTNLQRQIIHSTADVGRKKLDSAAEKLKAINPFLNIRKFETRLSSDNALELFRDFEIIADGTDNFPTRYLVNDACVLTGKPNVYGSIFRFEGQASVFAMKEGPCYRCLYPEPPPPGLVPSCAEGGVLGDLPKRVHELESSREIVARCRPGARSAKAVDFLRQAGFKKVHKLGGGTLAWADRVDPNRPMYSAGTCPVGPSALSCQCEHSSQ